MLLKHALYNSAAIALMASTSMAFAPSAPMSITRGVIVHKEKASMHASNQHPFVMGTSEKQQLSSSPTSLFSLEKNIDLVLNPDKDLLTKAYRRGCTLFVTLAAILTLIPDRTATAQLATKLGGAAGYAMAGGLCHILAGANKHDRLTSDTYTRLNLGLLGFNSLGILFVPAEAGFFKRAAPAILLSLITTVAQGYGIILSFLGWKRGVDPAGTVGLRSTPQFLVDELREGTKETLRGLRVDNPKKALAYRNALLLVTFGIFSSVMEGIFNFRYRDALQLSWFDVSLQGSAAARLFMITTMIYSLKDAGERDRLTGTTFIQLNLMLGLWSFAVGIGQSIYPFGFALYRGVEMFAFSILFFIKAFKSQVEKQEQAKQKLIQSN